jgi:16S rRNA (guanine527-N7)-methyltransferase
MEISDDVAALGAALVARGVECAPERLELLDRYREALWRWNEQLNLTRHTTLAKFVDRDVVDSWELAKLLPNGRRVLDIGAGGGVPGLIMAILRPDLRVTVCDSTQKKARVLESIVQELGLKVDVFGCRAEEVLAVRTFDAIVARAVAPLAKMLFWLTPHWKAFDELLMVKGRSWVDERAEARHRGLLKGKELRRAAVYEMAGVGDDGAPGESVILRVTRGADGVEIGDD